MQTRTEQNSKQTGSGSGSGSGQFTATRWTLVLQAGENSTKALEELCRRYWYPLYAYLRRWGKPAHEAQELTQGFFAHLLAGDGLRAARPGCGRFRSFLLGGLNNFVMNEWTKAQAQKRGGGQQVLSLDDQAAEDRYTLEPADNADPLTLFERKWAMTVLDHALERLRAEFAEQGKLDVFERLGPLWQGERHALTYAEVAVELGVSESAVKVAVHRMRRRYRELLVEEIAHTVEKPDEIEEEVRHFFVVLGR